jgi:hypothetical protein
LEHLGDALLIGTPLVSAAHAFSLAILNYVDERFQRLIALCTPFCAKTV